MTAKEFFRQVRRAERELKIIKAKLEHYEDLGFSLGGAVGVIGNKQRGSSRVRQVPQEKYRLILTYMYLLGKSPKWISDELEYNDPNSVYRAKGWALWEAQQIMNKQEEWKNNERKESNTYNSSTKEKDPV